MDRVSLKNFKYEGVTYNTLYVFLDDHWIKWSFCLNCGWCILQAPVRFLDGK